MKRHAFGVVVLLGVFCLGAPSYAVEEEEGEVIQDTTQQFKQEDATSKEQLAKTDFFDDSSRSALAPRRRPRRTSKQP